MKRRDFLKKSALATSSLLSSTMVFPTAVIGRAYALEAGKPLPIPEVIDCGSDLENLEAYSDKHAFFSGAKTQTWGFNQAYLGPVLRVKRGQTTRLSIKNSTSLPITAHWHGLHVEGEVDGGPHTAFGPGELWAPELDIDQPAATLWYHSHIHGQTAEQAYAGLAGMLIVDDPEAPPNGLPQQYGVDDIPLIVQDRAFSEDAQLAYIKRGPFLMHGFRAGQIVVNGAIRPSASVPAGLVRLRLLNASNARIYTLAFEDNREFHQVASDGGLLPAPVALRTLMLAPAERAEIIVDFSDGMSTRLVSGEDYNTPMAGGRMAQMMGGIFAPPEAISDEGHFEVMSFVTDKQAAGKVKTLPDILAAAPTQPDWGEPVKRRAFTLQMHLGGGGMSQNGKLTEIMGINGRPMDMKRIDTEAKLRETELWEVESIEMAHPFHIHGTHFQVLSQNGKPVDYNATGLKDVVLINGKAELLVHFTRTADKSTPYMYHCHILEHEDAGMMGQLTVS